MTRITISNLRKEYSTRGRTEVAVDGVDLTVEDGEFVSILGPSGCGKTTTLRCVGGLDIPTEGRIEFDGVDVTDVPANKRNLAMMFQDIALYPHMTVDENIAYPLKIKGVERDEREETVREAAEVMQIDDLLDKHPGELSGGQQQRAALARTLVQDPVAFLMDEPLSDLDAQLKVVMRKEIQRVHKRLGKPTIYVTHDQEEAITMSDRIVVLNEGEIEQVGHPEDIYERPNNTFVASFVGNPSINYLGGVVERTDGDEVVLSIHDSSIEIALDDPKHIEPGRRVRVGFRPQSISLSSAPGIGQFDAEIFLLEPVEDRIQVTLEGPEGELRAVIESGAGLEEGTPTGVTLDPSELYLFDPESGELLTTSR